MTSRLLSMISALFLLVASARAQTAPVAPAKPEIAVFDLKGEMGETPVDDSLALFGPPPPNLRDVVARMDKAAKDPDVKAVVVLEDDADFGIGQAEELLQAMKTLRDAGKDGDAHADDLMFKDY